MADENHTRKPRGRKPKSSVYFIQVGSDGPIKIGVAADVKSRLASLQTGHCEKLHVIATTPGGRKLEKAYHDKFSDLWIRGEWFRPGLAIYEELARLFDEGGDFLMPSMSEEELEFWASSPDPATAAPYIAMLAKLRDMRIRNGRKIAQREFRKLASGKTFQAVWRASA